MGRKRKKLQLDIDTRAALRDFVSHETASGRQFRRAQTLLHLDMGLSPKEVASLLSCSRATVYNIQGRYEQLGWKKALEDLPRPGAPRGISGKARAKITALACSTPPDGYGRWTLRLLADRAVELELVDSISHESVREVLKKTNSSLI